MQISSQVFQFRLVSFPPIVNSPYPSICSHHFPPVKLMHVFFFVVEIFKLKYKITEIWNGMQWTQIEKYFGIPLVEAISIFRIFILTKLKFIVESHNVANTQKWGWFYKMLYKALKSDLINFRIPFVHKILFKARVLMIVNDTRYIVNLVCGSLRH